MFRAVDVRETPADDGSRVGLVFELRTPFGATDIQLPMAGRHNVANAAAAAAAAHAAGASLETIRIGLGIAGNVPGRLLAVPGIGGLTLYDDAYNANPASVAAAIDFLAGRPDETWLVLGDMAELGPDSVKLHQEIGARAREAGISRLFGFGGQAREAATSFGRGAATFDDLDALTAAIREDARPGVTLLVKGSRCMGLDRLVAALSNHAAEQGAG